MRTIWKIFWMGAIFLLLFLLFLPLLALSPLRAVFYYLPLGWWHFLQRNFAEMTINWGLVGTGVLCSLLVIMLSHYFFSMVFREILRPRPASQSGRPWRWRWTISLYAALWLLFAIALGASGVFRHVTWLVNMRQPWYEERLNPYRELREVEGTIEGLLRDHDRDLPATRQALLQQRSYRRHKMPLTEDFNVIFYADQRNRVMAYLIIPRHPRLIAQGKFGISPSGDRRIMRPFSELSQTIAELDAIYLRIK